jgi:hypothetical protein
MKTFDGPAFNLALRAWLYRDETGRNAERVAAFVIEKATGGHFAYFKLVIDLVDGKLRRTAEEELTLESDCVLVVEGRLETERAPRASRAA